jgi:plasmid stabilization system protein ParE
MAYRIKVLPLANLELDEIDHYLTDNYPCKAKQFFEALKRQREHLKSYPHMFQRYEDFPPYRIALVLDYIMFYIVDEKNKIIEIHRILWGGMDLPNRLKEEVHNSLRDNPPGG